MPFPQAEPRQTFANCVCLGEPVVRNPNPDQQIKIRVFKARFFSKPSRLGTGDPDFGVFLFAQLPLSLLLTRKRVFIFF